MAKQCVNTCCGCCSLETGGYIIGWLNIIFGSIALILSIIVVSFSSDILNHPETPPIAQVGAAALITILSIYIIYTLLYVIAGILLVMGTRQREHGKMIMMLVLMGLGVFISFLNLIGGLSAGSITFSVLVASLQVYFFICIYSLYAMIKKENEGK